MGRTSKFTFPLPGRKQKPTPPTLTPVSASGLSKAQKTLGAGDINIDSPTLPKDPSKQWETRSNSGISICISESTASHPAESKSRRPDRGDMLGRSGGDRRARWEDESAILPGGNLVGGGVRSAKGTATDENDLLTDASSLRRRESSSTIVSYYDKSKLPLSISQQTSASAIARGLPRKASSILDIDGTRSKSSKEKKKPSRLDLSYLLPKSRSSKQPTASPSAPKGLVLGHDLVTRSPSIMSVSPDIGSLPIENKGVRSPRSGQFSPADSTDRARARAAASTANLPNLYDHYEQRSFRDISDSELGTATTTTTTTTIIRPPRSAPGAYPPQTPSSNEYLSPPFSSTQRPPFFSKSTSASVLSGPPETPVTALVTPLSQVSQSVDCGASISSRHTRTSKASKRTDRSLVEFDLHQNSVLSLSSDSEDDYAESSKQPVTPAARCPSRDWSLSPTSPNSLGLPQASTPSPPDVGHAKIAQSGENASTNGKISPEERLGTAAITTNRPGISARTSSLSVSSGATKTAASRGSVSRLSLASTATATSATPGSGSSQRDGNGYGVYEARAVSVVSAQSPIHNHNRWQKQQPAPRRASQTSIASECLSPVSIDFYLQSPGKPLSTDNLSIRSGRSMASVGSGASVGSHRSGHRSSSNGGRMMAVTRQEEMLLAALRMKRARMRENVPPELEGENESASDESPTHKFGFQHHSLRDQQPAGRAPDQPLPQPPKIRTPQDRSGLSSRHSSRRTTRLAPLHEMPQTSTPSRAQQRGPSSSRSAPAEPKTSAAQRTGDLGRGQILVYYDRPTEKMDDFDAAEPSPDLSDFMDYDEDNSDDLPLQTPSDPEPGSGPRSKKAHRPPRLSLSVITQGNAVAKGKLLTTVARSTDSDSLSSRSTPGKPQGEDVHVRIVEDTCDDIVPDEDIAGIPRPDSPISPAGGLPLASPLPRRKQVRLSAVGYAPSVESELWAHDG